MVQHNLFPNKNQVQNKEDFVLLTSSFLYTGTGRICIARWAPRSTPAGYKMYKKLAPDRDMLQMGYEKYHNRYIALLAELDPLTTLRELQSLAGNCTPVLLCWEIPPLSVEKNNWCHRTIVADWFTTQLGVKTKEI